MDTPHRHEVKAWVNPGAWDDEPLAERVVDAIMASGETSEQAWVRICGEVANEPAHLEALAAAVRDHERASTAEGEAREAVLTAAREAIAAGATRVQVARTMGISRQRLHKVL